MIGCFLPQIKKEILQVESGRIMWGLPLWGRSSGLSAEEIGDPEPAAGLRLESCRNVSPHDCAMCSQPGTRSVQGALYDEIKFKFSLAQSAHFCSRNTKTKKVLQLAGVALDKFRPPLSRFSDHPVFSVPTPPTRHQSEGWKYRGAEDGNWMKDGWGRSGRREVTR